MMKGVLIVIALCVPVSSFQAISSRRRATQLGAFRPDPSKIGSMSEDMKKWEQYKQKTNADGTKKIVDMTAWEVYTDGDNGKASVESGLTLVHLSTCRRSNSLGRSKRQTKRASVTCFLSRSSRPST